MASLIGTFRDARLYAIDKRWGHKIPSRTDFSGINNGFLYYRTVFEIHTLHIEKIIGKDFPLAEMTTKDFWGSLIKQLCESNPHWSQSTRNKVIHSGLRVVKIAAERDMSIIDYNSILQHLSRVRRQMQNG